MAAQSSAGGLNLAVLSCHPTIGTYGTKMLLKVSTQYELHSIAAEPYASVLFGSHRAAAHITKDPQVQVGAGACTYTISTDVPQFMSTGCASPSNVPLTLVIESDGQELARADDAGLFAYHDAHSGSSGTAGVMVGSGSGDVSSHEGAIKLGHPSPEHGASPPQALHIRTNSSHLNSQQTSPVEQSTNTYGYPPGVAVAAAVAAQHAQAQAQAQAQDDSDSNFAAVAVAGALTQDSGSMLGAYRTTGYGHYSRAPPSLRSRHSSGWTAYSSHYDAVHGHSPATGHAHHTAIARPSLTPLSHHHSSGPQLIRTSTLSSLPGGAAVGGSGYNNPYAVFPAKATLKIIGDLESMAENWTQEEWDNRRRIVLFKRTQHGSQLQTTFKPVSVAERPPNSICISCIYWAEKRECFVTSVDTIHLLEQLVVSPARFTVEEKNRIRRNLEGFHPLTVSKAKAESEEFFKVIMAFGNPKPRNIEKDVKVFPWKTLGQALTKIISKYSASPSSTCAPPMPTQLLTPVSLGGSYPPLPHTPSGSATTSTDPTSANGYITSTHYHHADNSVSSPRSLSGVPSSWVTYPSSGRTLSPALKLNSPASSSGVRISPLPAVYDPRTTATQSMTSPYGMPTHSHSGTHHQQHSPQHSVSQPGYTTSLVPVTTSHSSSRNWDGGYSMPDGYASHTSQAPIYGGGGGAYGDGTQRA